MRSLFFLFLGTPAPPPPFGNAASDCGEDPSVDALDCEGFPPCLGPAVQRGDLFPHRVYETGRSPADAAFGDFDGDGNADIAVATKIDVLVFRNQGDGTFAGPRRYGVDGNAFSVAVGDIDGDGDEDFAVTNLFDTTVSVLLNQSVR